LIKTILELKNSKIHEIINKRLTEFRAVRDAGRVCIFKELCFCIMTANCSAESCIKIQEKISDGFLNLKQDELSRTLRKLGYRFPNTRAKYIIKSREKIDEIFNILQGNIKIDDDLRE